MSRSGSFQNNSKEKSSNSKKAQDSKCELIHQRVPGAEINTWAIQNVHDLSKNARPS